MSVEPVDECLDGWLVQVTQAAGGLARLLTQHHRLDTDMQQAQRQGSRNVVIWKVSWRSLTRNGHRQMECIEQLNFHPSSAGPRPSGCLKNNSQGAGFQGTACDDSVVNHHVWAWEIN